MNEAELRALAASELVSTMTQWGASTWGEWHRCQQAHDLKHRQGVTPVREASYFSLGRLLHAGQAFEQRGVMRFGNGHPFRWTLVIEAAEQAGYDLEVVDDAYRLLDAYYAHWGLDNAGWPHEAVIVSVEELLTAPEHSLVHPYTARADGLLRMHDALVIPDLKSRASALPKGEDKRRQWAKGKRTSPQFLGLSWLLRERERELHGTQDIPPPAVWVNVIVKTAVPKFDRIMLQFTADELDHWALAQRATVLQAEALRTLNLPLLRNYSQCAPEIGSKCQYFDYCHGSQEQRDRHYKRNEGKEQVG